MPLIRFLPEAVDDLLETQRWYGRREPASVERIRLDPRSFPPIHGQIRRLVLRQFPYAVYFKEEGLEILVVALHSRQDPRRWQQRS
ncbi:MAG: hypothetical protein NTY67_00200 [Cyanobacteria bacterium]|nr:hypothetical protein [Cyanobacteriota bacterium]